MSISSCVLIARAACAVYPTVCPYVYVQYVSSVNRGRRVRHWSYTDVVPGKLYRAPSTKLSVSMSWHVASKGRISTTTDCCAITDAWYQVPGATIPQATPTAHADSTAVRCCTCLKCAWAADRILMTAVPIPITAVGLSLADRKNCFC